jgi:hypothetical protein
MARALIGSFLVMLMLLVMSGAATAHPADEFCAPGSGIDPDLCRALSELDSADATFLTTDQLLFDTDRTLIGNTGYFVGQGIRHILPGGTDHILFVLALFLGVGRFRSLALQISVFTLAHSVSLGLAAAGWVTVPGNIVEPLIAASIAFVAIENIFFAGMTRWRPIVVFGFGLFHGLGFAGFFLEQSLPDGFFWSSLIGFNIGVEIGQVAVVLCAYLTLRWFFRHDWYRPVIVIPASFAIAGVGIYWACVRILLG